MNTSKFLSKNLWVYPIITGLVLRLWDLTRSSIWHDEGYTMWLLKYGYSEIIARTARDVHPPFYYLLAKPWVTIFGNSEYSIRFLSVLFSLGTIYLAYKIIEKLFNQKAALYSSLLIAVSPFMVRFGQEARMYGVVAFFTTLATYFFVRFLLEKKNILLVPYLLAMLAAAYTQYYSFFVLMVHWIIMFLVTYKFSFKALTEAFRKKTNFFNPLWWLTSILFVLLYLPWFFVAYKQVTRVSGSYWILPEWITIKTIPGNILQFVTYSHLDGLTNFDFGKLIYWGIIALLFVPLGYLLLKKKQWTWGAVFLYGFFPMLLVYVLSEVKTPVYQDRYFPFSAIGIFAFWGIGISLIKNKQAQITVLVISLLVMLYGNLYMHKQLNHGMKAMTKEINSASSGQTIVISGELYTYLDGSYYLGYGNSFLLSDTPVDGYGETSLFYDNQDDYLISKAKVNLWLKPGSERKVILYGKAGKPYFEKLRCKLVQAIQPGESVPCKTEVIYDDGILKAVILTK